MKLNSLICLKNNHLTPLIAGLEENPILAVSIVNDFSEFKKDFNDYGLNYLLCLFTGNPRSRKKEEKAIDFIFQATKKYTNITPIIIIPFRFEKGIDVDSAVDLSKQLISKCPISLVLNLNGTMDKSVYEGKSIADVYKSYNEYLLNFFDRALSINGEKENPQLREIILETEVTGLFPEDGHKIVEIGCVELINHKPTGRTYHQYINPMRSISPDIVAIHGLTEKFLSKYPSFSEIADNFLSFIGDSPLLAHNARFDLAFLNTELANCGKSKLKNLIIDTLAIARKKFPGEKLHLNALCERFHIDISHRNIHGALLDSELLAEVYLNLIELKDKKTKRTKKERK